MKQQATEALGRLVMGGGGGGGWKRVVGLV